MKAATKQGSLSFSSPGNKLCQEVLSLFRARGVIYGYRINSIKTHDKGHYAGYPYMTVFLKYKYRRRSIIKDIKVFKNTNHNFYESKNTPISYVSPNTFFVISGTNGIQWKSSSVYVEKNRSDRILLSITFS